MACETQLDFHIGSIGNEKRIELEENGKWRIFHHDRQIKQETSSTSNKLFGVEETGQGYKLLLSRLGAGLEPTRKRIEKYAKEYNVPE